MLPLTQINDLVNRSESNKFSTKRASIQGSFYLTNKIGKNKDIINRNQKPLNKSTVPLASKSRDENIASTSFVDILIKKLDAFYRLSRPYSWINIVSWFLVYTCITVYWHKGSLDWQIIFFYLIFSGCRDNISIFASNTKSCWFDPHFFNWSMEGKCRVIEKLTARLSSLFQWYLHFLMNISVYSAHINDKYFCIGHKPIVGYWNR